VDVAPPSSGLRPPSPIKGEGRHTGIEFNPRSSVRVRTINPNPRRRYAACPDRRILADLQGVLP